MGPLEFLLNLLLYLLGGYLLFNVGYLLFFSVLGHRRLPALPAAPANSPLRRMCVLMPAYRADAVIAATAPAAVAHAYAGPAHVQVIADGLRPATVHRLREQGAGVLEVAFERSTKGKALLAALNALPPHAHDVAVILDVDNEMAPGFLTQINQAFAAGYQVVQGHRTAKNLDSPFAVLDACNEEINNHIFRQGHASLGLSAALIGSGMAFEYDYLHRLLRTIGDTPGEDKELDFRTLQDGIKIAYLPTAYVFDEKIPNARVFANQRTRWLATQQEFLSKYFVEGLRQLGRGNVDFADKIGQSLLLPRVLLLGLLGGLLGLRLLGAAGPPAGFWLVLLAGTVGALLLALPARLYTWQVGKAALHLPVALGAMLRALLQIRQAKKSFMPTPHAPAGNSSPDLQ
ncbi:glycosyltransferase family 2 protein [Hymenobacter actinosclerus]|uniref:Glycosyltransferase, catalytic subunit of cellulose synthase and poly-beta-1,6-N-acetylglucosamine synthase n=1 Tax=Hymenobacter actinosclerus TaxID=82805 RepID=A0A1I0J5P1_9BACT|nr:glycosyltransferase family 2 protein [Hymenobacter actinosclerus]SEU04308.1 Glycosyltransferase, catalytic subunit of cellulose synthase and poly-beta-1,6-N-acetylglucosamine synthase [Hymenobacter actinosclerus]